LNYRFGKEAQNFLTSLEGETLEKSECFPEQNGTDVILLPKKSKIQRPKPITGR
jgi:hypothetical protein